MRPVSVDALTRMVDALEARSKKFSVFFTRGELEGHVIFALWPVISDLTQSAKPDVSDKDANRVTSS